MVSYASYGRFCIKVAPHIADTLDGIRTLFCYGTGLTLLVESAPARASDCSDVCSSRPCRTMVKIRPLKFTSVFANKNFAAQDP